MLLILEIIKSVNIDIRQVKTNSSYEITNKASFRNSLIMKFRKQNDNFYFQDKGMFCFKGHSCLI